MLSYKWLLLPLFLLATNSSLLASADSRDSKGNNAPFADAEDDDPDGDAPTVLLGPLLDELEGMPPLDLGAPVYEYTEQGGFGINEGRAAVIHPRPSPAPDTPVLETIHQRPTALEIMMTSMIALLSRLTLSK